MIYYCFKEITPLKVEVSKLLFEETKDEKAKEIKLINYFDSIKVKQAKSEKIKGNFPPKKGKEKLRNIKNKKKVNFENIHSETKDEKKNIVKYDAKTINTEYNVLVSQKRKAKTKSQQKSTMSTKPSRKHLIDADLIEHLV